MHHVGERIERGLRRRTLLKGVGAGALAAAGITGTGRASDAGASSTVQAADGDEEPTAGRESITFDEFVGINAFVDDPIERIAVAGFVREYHNWHWDEGDVEGGYPGYPNNEIAWAPSYAGGGGWNFDEYYGTLAEAGIGVSPCLQRSPGWLRDANGYGEEIPVGEPDADTTDPASYEAKAHHMYQFAARFGATEVDVDRLTLREDQPEVSGLEVVGYVEDWNEPNKWWEGEAAEFSPQEYAAMSSAAYDGHAGTVTGDTATFGVKTADPSMKYVMGGTAGHSLEWIEAMDAWYREHRPDGAFVPDVINVHHYSHEESEDGLAVSPEADDFRGRLETLTRWRDEHHPEVEVWVSEFGWDTNQGSPVRAPPIGPYDPYEVQGQWLVRAYLAFAAAGVDRAQQYMLRDVDPNDSTQYSTCGLVTQKGEWAPKPSWYYVYTMKETLAGTRFDEERDSGRDDVTIYAFADQDGPGGAYALWCPTSDGTTVEGYPLELAGAPASATAIHLRDGTTEGEHVDLPIEGGVVTIDVSERPAFVRVDDLGTADEGCGDGIVVGDHCARDLNGDGRHRDLNGNGTVDFDDVVAFFEEMQSDGVRDTVSAFDFNGNGGIDFDDIVALFEQV